VQILCVYVPLRVIATRTEHTRVSS